jgi:serine/threonine protein kinase
MRNPRPKQRELFSSAAEPKNHSSIRKQINDYILESPIGRGSSSVVYLAVHAVTGERYAIKRLRLSDLARVGDSIANLEREVRMMRTFHHHNILNLIDILLLPARSEVYLVLEYMDNGSIMNGLNKLGQKAVMSVVKQIAQALRYLHEKGYVHQDIKPSNILLDGKGRAVLADFGIGHSFVSSSMVVGSPAYQAPEALDDGYEDRIGKNEEPQKEDVWALGVTLYQMLFGSLPFVGGNLFEIVNAVRQEGLRIPEGTDDGIIELLRGMLDVDPARRFDIGDVLEHRLVKEADSVVSGLPEGPKVICREGKIQRFEAEKWTENHSFAEIAWAIRNRCLIQECGFTSMRRMGDCCEMDENARSEESLHRCGFYECA